MGVADHAAYMRGWRRRFKEKHGIAHETHRRRTDPAAHATAMRAAAASRADRRDLWHTIRSGPCVDCDNVFHPCAMDFDHVRGEKLFNIADLCHGNYSIDLLLAELEKCELVCANCHRVRTFNRKNGIV